MTHIFKAVILINTIVIMFSSNYSDIIEDYLPTVLTIKRDVRLKQTNPADQI